jgi:hypothetical protein
MCIKIGDTFEMHCNKNCHRLIGIFVGIASFGDTKMKKKLRVDGRYSSPGEVWGWEHNFIPRPTETPSMET